MITQSERDDILAAVRKMLREAVCAHMLDANYGEQSFLSYRAFLKALADPPEAEKGGTLLPANGPRVSSEPAPCEGPIHVPPKPAAQPEAEKATPRCWYCSWAVFTDTGKCARCGRGPKPAEPRESEGERKAFVRSRLSDNYAELFVNDVMICGGMQPVVYEKVDAVHAAIDAALAEQRCKFAEMLTLLPSSAEKTVVLARLREAKP